MKRIGFIISILLFTLLFIFLVYGDDKSLADKFNLNEIYENVPESARSEVRKNEIKDASSLISFFSPSGIIDLITGNLFSSLKGAVKDFVFILSVLIIILVISSLKQGFKSDSLMPAFNLVSILVLSIAIFGVVQKAYSEAFKIINELAVFEHSVLAVMGSAIVASGGAISGSVIPVTIVTAISMATKLNTSVFMPLLNIYFALILAESLYSKSNISGIAKFIKSAISWGLGFASALLIGALTVQKSITLSADNLTAGALKFTVGSFLPVVGGVIKDAIGAVSGSISIIKSTAGGFGIAVILLTLLPIIINSVVYSIIFKFSAGASAFLDESKITDFLKNISNAWDILLAIIVCEGAFAIISLSLLMGIGSVMK